MECMFVLGNGITCNRAAGEFGITGMNGGLVYRCHITAPPVFKQQYLQSTGRCLLTDILRTVEVVPEVLRCDIGNRAVRMCVKRLRRDDPQLHIEQHRIMSVITALLVKNSGVWKDACTPKPPQTGCPSLQQMLVERLKDDEFKLSSCIHHASKRGAVDTWDSLRLLGNWAA